MYKCPLLSLLAASQMGSRTGQASKTITMQPSSPLLSRSGVSRRPCMHAGLKLEWTNIRPSLKWKSGNDAMNLK